MSLQSANKFVLDHAMLWTGDGRAFEGHVVVFSEVIEAVERGRYHGDLLCVDCDGMALAPGFVDIMVGGGFNQSLLHGDPLEIARRYLRLGVTTCQFAVGTMPSEGWPRLAANVRRAMHPQSYGDAADVAGVYFEGPFYDPASVGANNAALVWPATTDNVEKLLTAYGDIMTMVNVSPGIEGDGWAIRTLANAGVPVTMAHSAADALRVTACVEAGTSQLGHCWNNYAAAPMIEPGVHSPTLEHVALQDERVRFIHLICDGAHVHPTMLRLVLRCRGIESVCVVSDAINRAGAEDGPFTFDSGLRAKKAGPVGRLESGGLAGSALLLPDHFRYFVKASDLPGHEAIRVVTHNPAVAVGLGSRIGLLRPGYRADMVCLNDDLHVCRVWQCGRIVELNL